MDCLFPLAIEAARPFRVPCQKCFVCLGKRTRDWAVRLSLEAKEWSESVFVTLTYDNDHLPNNGSLQLRDVQLWLKRFRKQLSKTHRLCKYYQSGEYGDKNGRPHYHLVLFGVGFSDRSLIEKTWGKGRVHLGHVTLASARYTASYIVDKRKNGKFYELQGRAPPCATMSRRPGLGYIQALKRAVELRSRRFLSLSGRKYALPRYFKKLIWTDEERKQYRINYLSEDDNYERLNKIFNDSADYMSSKIAYNESILKSRSFWRRYYETKFVNKKKKRLQQEGFVPPPLSDHYDPSKEFVLLSLQ